MVDFVREERKSILPWTADHSSFFSLLLAFVRLSYFFGEVRKGGETRHGYPATGEIIRATGCSPMLGFSEFRRFSLLLLAQAFL